MGVELLAVIGDDADRLLAAMLQRMKSERRQRSRFGVSVDSEHTAFLMEMIVIQGSGCQHLPPLRAPPRLRPSRPAKP